MEAIIKKYQRRFRKVRDEMDCWDELQICLISQFRNASSIIERLQIHHDGKRMIKGGSNQPSLKQQQQRVRIKPSLADCLGGLMLLHEMHQAEYLLKSSMVSALSAHALKPK